MKAMRPLFADPKTDFVFKKLFGTEEHKPLLMALLNGLLELDEAHRVVEVELLSPEGLPSPSPRRALARRCAEARFPTGSVQGMDHPASPCPRGRKTG
ncbi:PD-(D/E)XK nuclease family transposase [Archangium sp.]|uniref:PD-(D/E)XK nuclease family transposase n=1 Tax=Archangium sp. TaxID=1872627 RepID=UPI002D3258EB|nr:PD-(D/E)XK nuclease family transposase [Archangium sp.]HYO57350.1 PD-(D/E)XK nuclease family transposase [Archangium sp.]